MTVLLDIIRDLEEKIRDTIELSKRHQDVFKATEASIIEMKNTLFQLKEMRDKKC